MVLNPGIACGTNTWRHCALHNSAQIGPAKLPESVVKRGSFHHVILRESAQSGTFAQSPKCLSLGPLCRCGHAAECVVSDYGHDQKRQ